MVLNVTNAMSVTLSSLSVFQNHYSYTVMKSYLLTYFKVGFICHIDVLRPLYIDSNLLKKKNVLNKNDALRLPRGAVTPFARAPQMEHRPRL